MNGQIVYTNDDNEFSTEERCHIIELLNQVSDRKQSIARARVEPGITTAWHSLKGTTEIYYILSGEGEAEIGESEKYTMYPNSLLKIPPDTAQRITNTGKADLIFLCFCTPAFSADNYQQLMAREKPS